MSEVDECTESDGHVSRQMVRACGMSVGRGEWAVGSLRENKEDRSPWRSCELWTEVKFLTGRVLAASGAEAEQGVRAWWLGERLC